MRRRRRTFWSDPSHEPPRGDMLSATDVSWYGPLPYQVHVRRRLARLTEEML